MPKHDVLANPPAPDGPLPAAEIVNAVLDQLRDLLHAPEILVRTFAAPGIAVRDHLMPTERECGRRRLPNTPLNQAFTPRFARIGPQD
jgi:hypothetical protein